MRVVRVVWDESKNTANEKKHGVSFQEAEELSGVKTRGWTSSMSIIQMRNLVSFRLAQSGVGWFWSSGLSEMASRFVSSARDGRRDVSRNSTVSTGGDSE